MYGIKIGIDGFCRQALLTDIFALLNSNTDYYNVETIDVSRRDKIIIYAKHYNSAEPLNEFQFGNGIVYHGEVLVTFVRHGDDLQFLDLRVSDFINLYQNRLSTIPEYNEEEEEEEEDENDYLDYIDYPSDEEN